MVMQIGFGVSDKIDLNELRPPLAGVLFGSIEWPKWIGGPAKPAPEEAFRIVIERDQEFTRPEGDPLVLSYQLDVLTVASAGTDTHNRVIFSAVPHGYSELRVTVGFADNTLWHYPLEGLGHAEFTDSYRSFREDDLPGSGPWWMEPFRIELRPASPLSVARKSG